MRGSVGEDKEDWGVHRGVCGEGGRGGLLDCKYFGDLYKWRRRLKGNNNKKRHLTTVS